MAEPVQKLPEDELLIREIESAYGKIGCVPVSGMWYDEKTKRASPLAALAAAKGQLPTSLSQADPKDLAMDVINWAVGRFGYAWLQGFTTGADGGAATPRMGRLEYQGSLREEYLRGHYAGNQVRAHFKLG